MFDDLDQFLKTRKKPEVPKDLNARIIAAAARVPRAGAVHAQFDFNSILEELRTFFALPRPAYALAALALLIVGAMIGASADLSGVLPGLTTGDLASFMLIEDGFVAGEWV